MKKLVPKLQSAWSPVNYQIPNNSEPKSAKPTSKQLRYKGNSVSNQSVSKDPEVKTYERLTEKPLSGTDPIGEFYVSTVALNPVFKGLSWAGKQLLPYTARFTSGGVRNWIAAKSLSNTMNSDALNRGVTRVVNGNNIFLRLNNHSKKNPRQLRIEPQGNNLYRVHASTWGGITNMLKLLLYDALYDEIPSGGTILFPESSPDYLATRGTVAGLKRLERDPRWIAGNTKRPLLYTDKNDKISTFYGTDFYKPSNSTTSEAVSDLSKNFFTNVQALRRKYPNMIDSDVEYMPNSTTDIVSSNADFTPVYKINPGTINEKYMTQEYLTRLSKAGHSPYTPIRIKDRGFFQYQKPFDYITRNNKQKSLLGYFKGHDSWGGLYNSTSGISLVSPNTSLKVPSILFHERNMHGTDNVIDALDAWGPYELFISKLYNYQGKPRDLSGLNLLKESSDKKELRATIGELVRKFHIDVNKMYNPGSKLWNLNPNNLRGLVEEYVDNMSDEELIKALQNTNGYGEDYVTLRSNNPTFIKDLKNLIKYGYSVALGTKIKADSSVE